MSTWPEPKFKKGDVVKLAFTRNIIEFYLIEGVRNSKYSDRKYYLLKILSGHGSLTKPYVDNFDILDSTLATKADKLLYYKDNK